MPDVFAAPSSRPAPASPDAPLAPASPACTNCGAPRDGAFCSTCGQHQAGRITLRSLAQEIVGQLVEVDHGLLHTVVDLMRRPGEMIGGYFAGRRRKYTSPVTFVLVASALSILRAALAPDTQETYQSFQKSTSPTLSLLYTTPQRMGIFSREMALVETNKFVLSAAILIPIALMLRFMFRKRGVNLAEMGVFACYVFGEATLISAAVGFPLLYVVTARQISGFFVALSIVFLFTAGYGLFGRSISTTLRLVGAVAFGLLLMDAVVFTLPFVLA